MRVLTIMITIFMLFFSGCKKYRENPDFPFPEFNKGKGSEVVCPEPPIRKTLTCTEVEK